jgi:hypothetical protein
VQLIPSSSWQPSHVDVRLGAVSCALRTEDLRQLHAAVVRRNSLKAAERATRMPRVSTPARKASPAVNLLKLQSAMPGAAQLSCAIVVLRVTAPHPGEVTAPGQSSMERARTDLLAVQLAPPAPQIAVSGDGVPSDSVAGHEDAHCGPAAGDGSRCAVVWHWRHGSAPPAASAAVQPARSGRMSRAKSLGCRLSSLAGFARPRQGSTPGSAHGNAKGVASAPPERADSGIHAAAPVMLGQAGRSGGQWHTKTAGAAGAGTAADSLCELTVGDSSIHVVSGLHASVRSGSVTLRAWPRAPGLQLACAVAAAHGAIDVNLPHLASGVALGTKELEALLPAAAQIPAAAPPSYHAQKPPALVIDEDGPVDASPIPAPAAQVQWAVDVRMDDGASVCICSQDGGSLPSRAAGPMPAAGDEMSLSARQAHLRMHGGPAPVAESPGPAAPEPCASALVSPADSDRNVASSGLAAAWRTPLASASHATCDELGGSHTAHGACSEPVEGAAPAASGESSSAAPKHADAAGTGGGTAIVSQAHHWGTSCQSVTDSVVVNGSPEVCPCQLRTLVNQYCAMHFCW